LTKKESVCYLLISSRVLFTFDFGLVVPFKLPAIDPAAWWRKKVLGLKHRPGAGWRDPCPAQSRASTFSSGHGARCSGKLPGQGATLMFLPGSIADSTGKACGGWPGVIGAGVILTKIIS